MVLNEGFAAVLCRRLRGEGNVCEAAGSEDEPKNDGYFTFLTALHHITRCTKKGPRLLRVDILTRAIHD